MKSIIQEASSIAKAVEEAWNKAQKPQQFSVKVLEEAEKNFLGLTKKSAKVAIFFDEPQLNKPSSMPAAHKPASHKTTGRPEHKASSTQSSYAKTSPGQAQQQARPAAQQRPAQSAPVKNQIERQQPHTESALQPKKQFEPLWNQEMVDRTQEWMQTALKNSNNDHVKFTIEPQKFHLRITLSSAILPDPDKEKQLLASFSALILETLKRTFKMSLRGHKIVLTHQPR